MKATYLRYIYSFFIIFYSLVFQSVNLYSDTQTKEITIEKILELSIDSSINPATLSFLSSAYEKAEKEHFDLVLIKINTPGGLVSTTKQILSTMGDSQIPSAVWVHPEGASATSAGAIIASGAHILVMSQGTNIGAATPIELGSDIKNTDMKNKATNDLVALVQSLAETRGRNKEAYKKIVTEAASYTAKGALAENIIDHVVNSKQDFCNKINGSNFEVKGTAYKASCFAVKWEILSMDRGQKLLNVFADPNMTYILFVLGIGLLFLEFQMAGGFIAGTIGIICLILAAIGFQVLPLNFGALGLIVFSFILFILEVFVASFGFLTLFGIASLVTGSLFLYSVDDSYISVSHSIILAVTLSISLFVILITAFLLRNIKKHKVSDNYYSLKGKTGEIVEIIESHDGLENKYHIKISGEIWKATSEKTYKLGEKCEILQDQDHQLNLKI